jgi:hypothetical protein
MYKFILSIILFFSLTSLFGQWDHKKTDWTNLKTKQWVHYTDKHVKGINQYYTFYQYTKKGDSCLVEKLKIPHVIIYPFLDTLKSLGFKPKVKFIDKRKNYTVDIQLNSIEFLRAVENDSTFKYNYSVILTDIKTKKNKVLNQYMYRSRSDSVDVAFKNKDFKTETIKEVKGLDITILTIYSNSIFKSKKSMTIFYPIHQFFF